MAIHIKNLAWEASKSHWQGTHRTISPAATLARVKPYFEEAGLTRLANITHLDRIGIPVTQSIRPNSYSLTTASGKGVTLEAALTSAAMEALEMYCAETAVLPSFSLSYSKLTEQYTTLPLSDLALKPHSLFNVDKPERWCQGWDLIQHQEVAIPLQSVVFDYRQEQGDWANLLSFETISTNGLASGNHFLEAITAGLLEVIERDAITCWTQAHTQGVFPKPKIRLDSIDSLAVQTLLEKFRIAGLVPFIFDCTVDTQVPVYEVLCFDPGDDPTWTCHGCGAHLDPEVAMLRALTEAAQTRAIAISGSRDDCFQSFYSTFCLRNVKQEIEQLNAYPAIMDAKARVSEASANFEDDITLILQKLQQAGLQQAILVDLTPSHWDISVVRILVPGLEGFSSTAHDYRSKGRAAKFVQSQRYARPRSKHSLESMNSSGILFTHRPAGGL